MPADRPPIEYVALFDETQRAWNGDEATKSMQPKNGMAGLNESEPEFLISCTDGHPDGAVIVCLVGGGPGNQQGEAGLSKWTDSLLRAFPRWHIHMPSRLTDSEYMAG